MLLRTALIFMLIAGAFYALLLSIATTPLVTNKARMRRVAKHAFLVVVAVGFAGLLIAALFALEN